MRVLPTALPGVLLIDPDVHRDARGFFVEVFHAARYAEIGVPAFVQANHSRSVLGTIRGLHLQVARPQAKLIRVIAGEIYDVAVDVRRGSPTFGRWMGVTLSAESLRQCFIPEGFAHGFSVRSAVAEVEYKCTDYYDPSAEVGIAWDDPDIGIDWNVAGPILSERDQRQPRLTAVMDRLPRSGGTDL